eukprot:3079016-Pyramimonas_sp.AAC.1
MAAEADKRGRARKAKRRGRGAGKRAGRANFTPDESRRTSSLPATRSFAKIGTPSRASCPRRDAITAHMHSRVA